MDLYLASIWHFNSLTATPEAIFWKVFVPPVLYGVHGYFATWMAVTALFRPYEPWYFPGTEFQLPLTPGIFPKRQKKLAQAVASTVTDTLLTSADIKARAESLVTEENIYVSVDLFIESVLKEFRDTSKLHRLASDIAELSPTLLRNLVESTIDGLEHGHDRRIAAITEKIFDQVILSTRISYDQASEISARIMENFITPVKIRSSLITILSPQNISALDESIQAHASGPYKILARIIGVKRVCYEWRNFLEKEPEEAQQIIDDLVKRFGIHEQIALQISNIDLREMPMQSINKLRENVVSFVEQFMLQHKNDLIEACKRVEDEAMATVRSAIVRFNPASIPETWVLRAKRDMAGFAHGYLKRELGELLEKALPALGMYGLIANKIDLFTSQQLEALVKRICKQELKVLELFGGAIGVMLGLVQILVNAIAPT